MKVVCLKTFKRSKFRQFLQSNGEQLDQFILSLMRKHLGANFQTIAQSYLAHQIQENEASWDYLDLRESLSELLEDKVQKHILPELKELPWYPDNLLNHDQLVERCLSILILGPSAAANS